MKQCEICGDPVNDDRSDLCDSCTITVCMMIDRQNETIQ